MVKNAGIGGGDMGVGAENGGDTAVEVPTEGYLFTGGFGVDVDEDDLGGGAFCNLDEEVVGLSKGIVAGRHKDATLQVDDRESLTITEFALVEAKAGSAVGVVGGAKDATAPLVRVRGHRHVLEDLFFVPDVVAGGDDMGSHVEEIFGEGRGDSEASRGVFAVDDQEVDGIGFDDVREVFADYIAAG